MTGNTRRKLLLELFPKANQSATALSITSPIDFGYNCVAWAVGRTDRWWQPATPGLYWPTTEDDSSLETYIRMFINQGFSKCDSSKLENGFSKVALYVDDVGAFLHVARQLDGGRWSSKCGAQSDISHSTPELLEGPAYGRVWGFLKRPI